MIKMKNYDNVIVPIDGSKNSRLAFKRALSMAKDHPIQLHLVHVIDDLSNLTGADAAYIDTIAKNDRTKLNKYQKIADQEGVSADNKIAYGSPKVIIANDLVHDYHADLIIMGSNGLTRVARVLMGSVAAYVSHAAQCDVLLVKEKH